MAGFGLNPRHANACDQLNHTSQEPFSGLIACRICDSIFMSEKALFDHIELHLSLDESAARRKVLQSHLSSSQRSLQDNNFNQNSPLLSTRQQVLQQPRLSMLGNGYASSILPNERNNFSIGTNTRNFDLQSIVPFPIPTCSRNINIPLQPHPTPPVAPQIIFVPQPRIDCFTRPFLNQLETTLLVEGMASFANREMPDKAGDQQKLDVTLKLGREEN